MTDADHPDAGTIQSRQLAMLRSLLGQLRRGNRFYGPRLESATLGDDVESLDAFIRRMPLTTKTQVLEDQRRHPPFGTNLTYPIEAYTRFSQTSATTAEPMRWLDTPQSWSWMLDCWQQIYDACGVTASDRVFFAFSFGPFLGFWTAFDAATRMGCLCIPGGGMGSAARLHALMDNQATVLCCTPTYALHLGQVAAEQGIDLGPSRIRAVIVAGEPGGSVPATRSAIEHSFPGARVYDHHGMTEVGPVTYQCPARVGLLHVLEPAFLAEVLDPATFNGDKGHGRSVDPGDTGELVLTTLGRTGSPLLRYRTGDIVRPLERSPCPCGCALTSLEGGILGRLDEMLIVRGVNLFPTAVDEVIRARGGTSEYRVTVTGREGLAEIEIEIEPEQPCPDADELCERIQADLRRTFQLRVPVRSVAPGALPRFEMKARRWVRVNY
jgi:phenylacetate-CoA ligase